MLLFKVHKSRANKLSLSLRMLRVAMMLQMVMPHLVALSVVDHGVMGEVFPIHEKNLVEVIQAKLAQLQADGKLETYNQQIQAKVKKQIERPTPVAGITYTRTAKTFTFDPSITVATDLKDHNGVVFYHKGERINPLEYRVMTEQLLFIDSDESAHITWAFRMLKIYPLAKIILVSGAPLQILQDLGIQVYFDQHGRITKKLGITQVPAIVTQEGKHLKIEEVKADIGELVEMRLQEAKQKQQRGNQGL